MSGGYEADLRVAGVDRFLFSGRSRVCHWLMVDLCHLHNFNHAPTHRYLSCCTLLLVWRLLIRGGYHNVHLP